MSDLSENWTSVAGGSIGYMGFESTDQQSPDLQILTIWFMITDRSTTPEQWKEIFNPLFKKWSWSSETQDYIRITIQLKEALKNPMGLLHSLSEQLDKEYSEWVRDSQLVEYDYGEEEESLEEYQPQQVWYTEPPGGHNGWE